MNRRTLLVALAFAGSIAAASEEVAEALNDSDPSNDTYVHERLVLPNGSFLADKYWRNKGNPVSWTQITSNDIPQGARVIPVRTVTNAVTGSQPLAPQSSNEPTIARAAPVNSAVVRIRQSHVVAIRTSR